MMPMPQRNDQVQLRQYLLGDVADDEQKTIEQRLLTSAPYFNELVRIEEELTDEYAAGELDARERELFEARFMHDAERRAAVEFAQVLRRYAEQETSTRAASTRSRAHLISILTTWRGVTAIAGASVMIVLAIGLGFVGWQSWRLEHQYQALQQEHAQSAGREAAWSRQLDQERAKAEEIRNQLQQEREQRKKLEAALARTHGSSPATMASLTLLPGLSRTSEPAPTVRLSNATQELRLRLEGESDPYREYLIQVQTAEGATVWKQTINTVHRTRGVSEIVVTLPVPMLTMRDYLVLLAGVNADGSSEHLATYNFTVLKQ